MSTLTMRPSDGGVWVGYVSKEAYNADMKAMRETIDLLMKGRNDLVRIIHSYGQSTEVALHIEDGVEEMVAAAVDRKADELRKEFGRQLQIRDERTVPSKKQGIPCGMMR